MRGVKPGCEGGYKGSAGLERSSCPWHGTYSRRRDTQVHTHRGGPVGGGGAQARLRARVGEIYLTVANGPAETL